MDSLGSALSHPFRASHTVKNMAAVRMKHKVEASKLPKRLFVWVEVDRNRRHVAPGNSLATPPGLTSTVILGSQRRATC